MPQTHPTTERWTLHRIAMLAVLILLCEVVLLGYNLVIPALGSIAVTFATADPVLTITVYTLLGATGAPLMGKLADIHGQKQILAVTALFLAVGGAVSAMAPNFPIFLTGRALEGIGLAALPLSYSLARELFPPKLVALAVALIASGSGVATVAAPLLAGHLIDTHGFRSVFVCLTVASAVAGLAVLLVIPRTPARSGGHLDLTGALLLAVGVGLLIVGASLGSGWGWGSARTLALLFGSGAILTIWVLYTRRAREPLVDLALLRRRPFFLTVLAAGLLQPALAAAGTLLTLMVMVPASLGMGYGFGEDATGVSRYTSVAGVATVLGGVLLGMIAGRQGLRAPFVAGSLLLALGSGALALLPPQPWQVILAFAVFGVGGGIVFSAIPNLVVRSIPESALGIGSTSASTIQTLAATAGLQLIVAAVSRGSITSAAGQAVYTSAGMSLGFLICAALCLLAAGVGWMLAPAPTKPSAPEKVTSVDQ